MNTEICSAISERRLLDFYYENFHRIVEPYTYGIDTAGNDVLSAYQIEGQVEKGYIPSWRLFSIEKMKNVQLLSKSFSTNQCEYRKRDKRMTRIYCEI